MKKAKEILEGFIMIGVDTNQDVSLTDVLGYYLEHEPDSQIFQDKFFKFLDMAGNFYEFNRYLNGFNMHVYLGGTPSSNKESVIENWKKYRNIDIEIDESKYNEEDEE